jgi:hypothetical protein
VNEMRFDELSRLTFLTPVKESVLSSLADIGRREGIATRYVERLSRLAFVAPTIVEAISAGRQPGADQGEEDAGYRQRGAGQL